MIDWLLARTSRERVLLSLMAVVVISALVWLLALAPAQERRSQALADWDDARALQVWVSVQAEEALRLRADAPQAVPPPLGLSGLEQSLILAGLRDAVATLTAGDDGKVSLVFDRVIFTELGEWLRGVSLSWGYRIADLQIAATDAPGLVSARLALTPAS